MQGYQCDGCSRWLVGEPNWVLTSGSQVVSFQYRTTYEFCSPRCVMAFDFKKAGA